MPAKIWIEDCSECVSAQPMYVKHTLWNKILCVRANKLIKDYHQDMPRDIPDWCPRRKEK